MFRRFANSVNQTPWKRRTAHGAFFLLYAVTGVAGFRYLQETRDKRLKPKQPVEQPKGGVVEPHDTTPVYEKLASEYDKKINREELFSYVWWMRRRVAQHVRGDALEVSCGTGRNLYYLNPAQLHSLVLVDSSLGMLKFAQEKLQGKYHKKFENKQVQLVQGSAETLTKLTAKSQQRFDTVFETFGLCSHSDPDAALREMADVLRPDGRIVLLEHGRGDHESMNKRLDMRAQKRADEWGCRWNLDIDAIVERSGLHVVEKGKYHFGTVSFYVLKK